MTKVASYKSPNIAAECVGALSVAQLRHSSELVVLNQE